MKNLFISSAILLSLSTTFANETANEVECSGTMSHSSVSDNLVANLTFDGETSEFEIQGPLDQDPEFTENYTGDGFEFHVSNGVDGYQVQMNRSDENGLHLFLQVNLYKDNHPANPGEIHFKNFTTNPIKTARFTQEEWTNVLINVLTCL